MKKITITIIISLTLSLQSFGQINPIENLTWDHYYDFGNNYFILQWDEPALPHDQLIGYNIYRDDDLYLFQTETSMYNLEQGSNCGGEDFLFYPEGSFFAHVTAVYEPGNIESSYLQTVFVLGPLLNIGDKKIEKPILYPNPVSDQLFISSENLQIEKISIYSISGKVVLQIEREEKSVDVSSLSEGIYFIEVTSPKGKSVQKFIKH